MGTTELPRSAAVLAVLSGGGVDHHPMLEMVRRLAGHHQTQWDAEDASRAPNATIEHKRVIDDLNAKRVALVTELDAWALSALPTDGAQIHTETLGAVMDRIAIGWVRATKLAGVGDAAVDAEAALAELAQAYDHLVDDILGHKRRLPRVGASKTYRYQAVRSMSPDHPPITVSLNGVDNVGKTTQLSWLHRGLSGSHLVGTIGGWDTRWRQVGANDFAAWWFERSSTEQHVELIATSYLERRKGSGLIALEDRGAPMLHVVCAATAAMKEGIHLDDAMERVRALWPTLPATRMREEVHILLRRSLDPTEEARAALSREREPVGERYATYQRLLARGLHAQAEAGHYDLVLDVGDLPVLEIQKRIRSGIRSFSLQAEPLPDRYLERLWVLAGLSEAGKSTLGELLRDEYGVTRLKIGYLLESAARRKRVADPYRLWSEPEQAEQLAEEVLYFAEQHKVREISLESAHREGATRQLQNVWGRRCRVVYVDAPGEVRLKRATEPAAEFFQRERTKLERGAGRISEIASHVVDNTGPLCALKLGTSCLAALCLPRRAPPVTRPKSQVEWLEAAASHLVDDEVLLIMATGNTGRPQWRPGWSDLDLLIIRQRLPLGWLQDRIGTLPSASGVKIAISAFTDNDIKSLRVPPRVVHALRRAALSGVLYCKDGYTLPVPTLGHDDRASRGELGLVLMTLRRLLVASTIDVRDVYKHVVLVAKILLRADGLEFEGSEEVMAVFCATHRGSCDFDMPPLEELSSLRDDGSMQQRIASAAGWILEYVDGLGASALPRHKDMSEV